MGRKGRFLAQRAGITLWAQLMPAHTVCVWYMPVDFHRILFTNNGEIDVQMNCTQEKRERGVEDPMG